MYGIATTERHTLTAFFRGEENQQFNPVASVMQMASDRAALAVRSAVFAAVDLRPRRRGGETSRWELFVALQSPQSHN